MINLLRHTKRWLVHARRRHLSTRDWEGHFAKVARLHPECFTPCAPAIEREHVRRWRALRSPISLKTLRMSAAISGVADTRIVPQEVYVSEIQPVLNREPSLLLFEHKSFYGKWFRPGIFPTCYLHNITGNLYDAEYAPMDSPAACALASRLPYPVVFKPNRDTKGGSGVAFCQDPAALINAMAEARDYVVQERIAPHPYFAQFNATGLNTLRCCVFRSPNTQQLSLLNVALRMGRQGRVDNLDQGGIVMFVNPTGQPDNYARDNFGGRYAAHPDSQVPFAELGPVPFFDQLKPFVLAQAAQVWFARLISFDVCLDEAGAWRLVEINLRAQTISFAQFAGHPFFGEHTDEVIEYCRRNRPW